MARNLITDVEGVLVGSVSGGRLTEVDKSGTVVEDEDVEVVVEVSEVVVVVVDEVVEGVLVGLVSGVDDTDVGLVVVDDVVLELVVLELVVVVVEVLGGESKNGRETETLMPLLLGSELRRFTVNADSAICAEFMSS